jgi:hypothetical protein
LGLRRRRFAQPLEEMMFDLKLAARTDPSPRPVMNDARIAAILIMCGLSSNREFAEYWGEITGTLEPLITKTKLPIKGIVYKNYETSN